ncbi:MAG: sugar phosphate isomerase/epimerase [Clostridiales bacterium]|jgi:sugar phosphate isomerase/epimerase|nr:sugar phosphate isomerase/epimerase [Clostridiales bacterium]
MLALNTDYAGEGNNLKEVRETLKKIADAGFTHIHWCHDWDGDYTYSLYEMMQIRHWMDQEGLQAKALHATKGTRKPCGDTYVGDFRRDYTSANEYSRLAGVELIKNRVDMACVLGASEIVLHMLLPYLTFEKDPSFEQQYYQQVFASFDELKAYCKMRKIKICLENMLDTPIDYQIKQFDLMFQRYEKDFIGLCVDTGHALISNGPRMMELPARYQERIYCVHLNDNFGIPSEDYYRKEALMCSCDLHRPPYEGNFAWNKFLNVLANSPYELPLLLEVSLREDNEMDFLKRSYEAGRRLTKQLLEVRGD